ncbi:MAG: hypothetical protein IT347_00675 [Candidatus Eisenbacteria bacterium]|nr:hypothetical protein [Candidatus Eisenbacteria bacterium]
MSGETTFWATVDALREARPRYAREAYGFVVAALGETVKALPRERLEDERRRHLSGQELLAGVVAMARREFGPMAPVVFREWGVVMAEDVGEIVFELVRTEQLSARPEDTLDDFRAGFDLEAGLRTGGGDDAAPRSGPGNRRTPAA